MGFLTGLCGLACDNIIGGTIVLPSGIVIGTLQENKDLLWAIRGKFIAHCISSGACKADSSGSHAGAGAGAFGCITEFIIQLHSLPRTVSAGIGFYAPEQVPELIPKIEKFLKVRTSRARRSPISGTADFLSSTRFAPPRTPASLSSSFTRASRPLSGWASTSAPRLRPSPFSMTFLVVRLSRSHTLCNHSP